MGISKQRKIQGAINLISVLMKNFKGIHTIDLLQDSDIYIDIEGSLLAVTDKGLFKRIKVLIEELYDDIDIHYEIEMNKGIQGLHADYIIWDDLIGEINKAGDLVDDFIAWKEGLINE